jgi:hypothetical protein
VIILEVATPPVQLIDYAGSCQTSDGWFSDLANRPTSTALLFILAGTIPVGSFNDCALVVGTLYDRALVDWLGWTTSRERSANVTVSAFHDCTRVG